MFIPVNYVVCFLMITYSEINYLICYKYNVYLSNCVGISILMIYSNLPNISGFKGVDLEATPSPSGLRYNFFTKIVLKTEEMLLAELANKCFLPLFKCYGANVNVVKSTPIEQLW